MMSLFCSSRRRHTRLQGDWSSDVCSSDLGWFATLLDSALGCAVHTCMPPGRGYTTAELGVNLVKALTPRVPRVRAEGRVLHCGRQLATAEARLVGPDGTLYAHATTTCLVFEMPPAR